jgi:serine/threonine protein kinase
VDPEKLYEFQHEMVIMRYYLLFIIVFIFYLFVCSTLHHENLVQLLGITKQPLRLVLEFIPNGDLHNVLLEKDKSHLLTLKWRVKTALDIADGLRYFLNIIIIYFYFCFWWSLHNCRYLQSQTPPICHSDLRSPNIFVCIAIRIIYYSIIAN